MKTNEKLEYTDKHELKDIDQLMFTNVTVNLEYKCDINDTDDMILGFDDGFEYDGFGTKRCSKEFKFSDFNSLLAGSSKEFNVRIDFSGKVNEYRGDVLFDQKIAILQDFLRLDLANQRTLNCRVNIKPREAYGYTGMMTYAIRRFDPERPDSIIDLIKNILLRFRKLYETGDAHKTFETHSRDKFAQLTKFKYGKSDIGKIRREISAFIKTDFYTDETDLKPESFNPKITNLLGFLWPILQEKSGGGRTKKTADTDMSHDYQDSDHVLPDPGPGENEGEL